MFLSRGCLHVFFSAWVHFQYDNPTAGHNAELGIFFYRLSLILKMPAHVVFVFDGPAQTQAKYRNLPPGHGARLLWITQSFRELIKAFGFRWHEVDGFAGLILVFNAHKLDIKQAPGEAEAELAALSQRQIIDIVLTTEVDALIFGATRVARSYVVVLSFLLSGYLTRCL